MSYILLAIIGHLANAVAFIIDKILLTSAFKRSATYAAMIGGLSLIVLLAAPWVKHWPSIELALPILAYGGLFVFGLWTFFEALKRSEASQVVPVVGSLIPIFTLIGTSTILHERLSGHALIGFAFLIVATVILTGKTSPGPSLPAGRHGFARRGIGLMILSAVLFAASFVAGKFAYNHADFLAVFVSSRAVAGLIGVMIGVFHVGARKELSTLLLSLRAKSDEARQSPNGREEIASSSRTPSRNDKIKNTSLYLTILGQLMGAIGFILINIAIARGSASIVNALQAVQYGAIVLVAWFAGDHIRKLLNEKRTPRIILIKSCAIVLIAIGLGLISIS